MSNACLHLEFLAGTSFTSAVEEAKHKCKLFDLAYVRFDFNGVSCSVRFDTDIEKMETKFFEAINNNNKFIIGTP